MRTAESSSSAPPLLSETQRSALVSLLADDDPAVYRLVRAKLLAYGEVACLWLRPHALSGDPKMRRRAQEILNYHGRLHHDARFVDYAKRHGEDLDLEEGVGFLTRTRYPDVTWEGYSALLDQWAATIQGQMQPQTRAEHALGIINHFLFEELGFQGSDQVGYDPECCFLNRIIDQRKGNPIGLCTLYLFIARRLRLPITGIGLPSHFVCRYQSTTAEIYIDCFRKGVFLAKADCVKFLLSTSYGLSEGSLAPYSPRRILHRMCNNLVLTYGHLEQTDDAARAKRYAAALHRA